MDVDSTLSLFKLLNYDHLSFHERVGVEGQIVIVSQFSDYVLADVDLGRLGYESLLVVLVLFHKKVGLKLLVFSMVWSFGVFAFG